MQLSEVNEYSQQPQENLLPRYSPEIFILDTPELVDGFAAMKVIELVQAKPNSALTLPTGNTPIGMYKHIVKSYRQGIVDFTRVTIFNLDEYYPIAQDHPGSYAAFMKTNLIDHVSVSVWHIPNGEAPNPEMETGRYKNLLEQYQPIDLAVLGIGPSTTCHIGFNEGGSAIDSVARYVSLHPETKQTNAKLFANPEEIPNGALTQGIADILRAKNILVIAKGASKSWGINRTLKGTISSEAPASFLRLHPNVSFVLDQEAAMYIK